MAEERRQEKARAPWEQGGGHLVAGHQLGGSDC